MIWFALETNPIYVETDSFLFGTDVKKQTIEKLEFFFEFMQPESEEHKFTDEEIEEVGNALRSMLP